VVSTIVVIIGTKLSAKGADAVHQYGRERLECIAALILAGLLFATGIGIGISSYNSIVGYINGETIEMPGLLALIAAFLSIVIKEAMYWYTIKAAKKIRSTALKADAWHHRSDALSSVATLIGIGGARLGFRILDPIAAGIVCLFIIKVSIEIATDAIDELTDKAVDKATAKKLRDLVTGIDGVYGVKHLFTRQFGSLFYADIEVLAQSTMTLADAHKLATEIEHKVDSEISNIKACKVIMLPADLPHREALERHDKLMKELRHKNIVE